MSKTDNIFEASFYFYVSNYNFNESVEILYKAKSYIFNYFVCVGKYNNINIIYPHIFTLYVYFKFLFVRLGYNNKL